MTDFSDKCDLASLINVVPRAQHDCGQQHHQQQHQHHALWCGNGTNSEADGAAKILTRGVHANDFSPIDDISVRHQKQHRKDGHRNIMQRYQAVIGQSVAVNCRSSVNQYQSQSRAISRSSSALRHQCVMWYLCIVFQCRLHHCANIIYSSGDLKWKIQHYYTVTFLLDT